MNTLKERLLKYSKWNGECLESTYKSGGRYPMTKYKGSMKSAHRLSWMVHFGEIPEGLWVLHKCDNPLCIRPEHLFLGTPQDNTNDMKSKCRENFQGARKHPKDVEENVIKLKIEGKTYKEIKEITGLNLGTLSTIIRKNRNREEVKSFYLVSKYPKETIEKAHSLRESGVKCKDIQKILGIPKRSLCRIFNQPYKRVYVNQ